ncbi:hypothetical protein EON65_14440 [archaeon]|nr:MAG: hypothetical protein EON65_14440 [archaeon]
MMASPTIVQDSTLDERWLRNSVRLFGPISVPSRARMYNRFLESAISLPKMFLSGFLWEGFGLS